MKNLLLFIFCLLISGAAFGQTTLLTVDFETDLSNYSHTPSQTPSTDPGDQYFHRAEPSNTDIYESGGQLYTNVTGSWMFVGSNPNTINSGDEGLLTLSPISVAGYSNLELSADFGAVPNDWDASDDLRVEYNFDGGTWTTLFNFTSPATNNPLVLAGNSVSGSNTANGTTLTFALQTITSTNFTGTGTILNIRIACNSGANYEAFGVDNIVITGISAGPLVGFDSATSTETETNATFTTTVPVTLGDYGGSQVDLSVAVTGGTAEVADYTLNTTSLSFMGDGTQNISIDINPDADYDDETIEITITETTSTGITVAPSVHTITVTDDDIQGAYTLGAISGNTNETGTTATFTVVLDNQPASDVVLNVSSADTDENTVSPATLTFTNADWNIAQTVTVTGVDDAIVDSEQTTTITVAVNDGASAVNYAGLSETIDVINEDDDIISCTVPVWIIEEVALNSQSDTWTESSGDYSVNGYVGSASASDLWLIYGPLDMTSTSVLNLGFDLTETFSGPALNFQYSTDYVDNASTATWTSVENSLTGNITGAVVDYGAAAGMNTYIAIQYTATGLGSGGSGDYDLTNISLEADVCPSAPCLITGVMATTACNGDDAEIVVTWTESGTSGTTEVDINGEGYQTMVSGDTYTITGPTTAAPGVIVTVRDAGNTSCMSTTTVDIMECPTTLFCESFDDGSVPTADGWTNTGVGNYSSGNFAAKSLKFDGTGDQLATPVLVDATELSFYIKGNGTNATSALLVEAWDGSTFVTLENITNLPTSYTQKVYSSLPNYQGFRFTYTKSAGNVAFDDICYTTASVTSTILPLPVELTTFKASRNGNSVDLTWSTATEENNAYFDVQSSVDGRNFETIGQVEGAGTTYETQEYSFIDENPASGLNYYRLRQVDFDGAFEYHKVISVLMNGNDVETQIYPNPTRGELNVVLPTTNESEIQVIDLTGKILRTVNSANDGITTLDVADLPNGQYMIRIINEQSISTSLFVKTK